MKRFNFLLVLTFATSSLVKAQTDTLFHSCLFSESSIMFGASSIYGLDFKGAGVNGRVYYNASERFCLGPEFSYLSAKDKSLYDVNIIAHYIFDVKGIGVYPVGGLNYSFEKESSDQHGTESTEALGIVTGAGIHRNFKRLTLFFEYSHHFSELPDDFLNLGILISFKAHN